MNNRLWTLVGVVLVAVLVSSVGANDSSDGINSNALNQLLPVVSRNGGVVNGTVSVDMSPSCFLLSAQFTDTDSNKTPPQVQQLTINAIFYDVEFPEELDSNILLSLSPNLTPTPYNTPYISKRNAMSLTVYDQLNWTDAGRICVYIHNAPRGGDDSTEIAFGISVQAIYMTTPDSVHNSTIIADFQPGECQYYHILPPIKNPSAGVGYFITLNVMSDNPAIAVNVSSTITGPTPYYQNNITMIFYPPTNTTDPHGYYLSVWNTDYHQATPATITISWSIVQPQELVLGEDYTEAQVGWNYFFIALPPHETAKHSNLIVVPAVTLSAAFTSVPSTETIYFDVYVNTIGVANKGDYSFYFTTPLQSALSIPDMKFPIGNNVGEKVFVSIYIPETTVFASLTATYGHKNYTFAANATVVSTNSGYFEIPEEQNQRYWVATFSCASNTYATLTRYLIFNLDNPSQCISSQPSSQCYSPSAQMFFPFPGLWFFDFGISTCVSYRLNVLPRVYTILNDSDTSSFYPDYYNPVVAVYHPRTFQQQVTMKFRNYNGNIYIGTGHENLLHVLSTLPSGSTTAYYKDWITLPFVYYYTTRPTVVFNNVEPEPIYVVIPSTSSYYNLVYVDIFSATTIGTATCNNVKIQSLENGWKYYRTPIINPSDTLTVTLTLSNIGDASLWVSAGVGSPVIPSPNNATNYDRSTNAVKTITLSNTGSLDPWNATIGVNTTNIARYSLSACVTENSRNPISPIPLTVSSVYGSQVYYYDVTESQIQDGMDTMLFQVRCSSTYYFSRVYVKYGTVPTAYDNDYNVSTSSADMILINPLRSGRYYIKFEGTYYTYYNITLTASKRILLPIANSVYVNASIPTLGFKIYKLTVTNNDDPLQVSIPYASLPTTGYNFNVALQHSFIPSTNKGEYLVSIPANTFLPTYAFTIERPHLGDWFIMTYGSGEVVLQVDYSGYTINPKHNKKRETKDKKKVTKKVNKVKLTAN